VSLNQHFSIKQCLSSVLSSRKIYDLKICNKCIQSPSIQTYKWKYHHLFYQLCLKDQIISATPTSRLHMIHEITTNKFFVFYNLFARSGFHTKSFHVFILLITILEKKEVRFKVRIDHNQASLRLSLITFKSVKLKLCSI